MSDMPTDEEYLRYALDNATRFRGIGDEEMAQHWDSIASMCRERITAARARPASEPPAGDGR